MERITGNQVASLMESYHAVYDENLRETLHEENEIQEFLEIINSLVEEGYDLSEYTYDELYEDYISEGGVGSVLKGIMKYGGKGLRQAWNIPAGRSIPKEIGARTVQSGAKALGHIIKGGIDVPKSGLKTIGQLTGQITKHPIVAVPLIGAGLEAGIRGKESVVRQALGGAYSKPPTAKPSPTEKPKSTKKEEPKIPQNLPGFNEEVQIVIKKYLLDEGFADTEYSANKIIENMSQEWKESIILNYFNS